MLPLQSFDINVKVVKDDVQLETKFLTLKAPITTEADDKFCNIFPSFQQKLGMIFHVNRLLADNSYEI